ncbi:flagellar brake protein [Dethiobacter alkaliphilus]|uniref:flagellar brake protein n=1 Tax=Dethiobacter alkaliphilus TaxID=427926 RepID=UPI002226A97D|nr:flagellar brake domain-containing protein [Dethiobacter alkaliphilus]MCW3488727.1 PilZ domain-containing protein [Dethiobacter alkaliphilus]
MKKVRLQLQQKLEVMLLPDGDYYKSSVQEVDKESVAINIPIHQGRYLLLQPGEMVRVEFAIKDAIYRFESKVLGRKKSNNVPLIILERPTRFARRQRRSFVRMPVMLPVEYRLIFRNEDTGLPEVSDTYTGNTVDISGGGLQIADTRRVARGDTALVNLRLDDGNSQALSLSGKISWVYEDARSKTIRFGIGFADISEVDQERIIAYIFSKMRQRTQT